jgi:hypothetical protein
MNVLAIDVGGTNVKVLATGQAELRKLPSGPTMTPADMVCGVKQHVGDWSYDVVSIGGQFLCVFRWISSLGGHDPTRAPDLPLAAFR